MPESFYDVLGVSSDASRAEMEEAFRQKVLETHPDQTDDEDTADEFKRVTTAKEVLTNPKERQQYDRLGHEAYIKQAGLESLWTNQLSSEPEEHTSSEPEEHTSSEPEEHTPSGGSAATSSKRSMADERRNTARDRNRSHRTRSSGRRGSSRSSRQSTTGAGDRGTDGARARTSHSGTKQNTETRGTGKERRRRTQEGNRTRQRTQRNRRAHTERAERTERTERAERTERTERNVEWAYAQANRKQQQAGLFDLEMPTGLGTTGVYSVLLTGVWLLGRGVIRVVFDQFLTISGITHFLNTFEFGVLAVFSFVVIFAYTAVLDMGDLSVLHFVLIFGIWIAVLPVWYISPFQIGRVSPYALLGIANILFLAVMEESWARRRAGT